MTSISTTFPQPQPEITILSYTAESDVVYAPDRKTVECRHRRIWQHFASKDLLKARHKACIRVHREMDRLAVHTTMSADPASPYQGLKLYFEYRIIERVGKGKHPVVHRFYLLDGENVTRTELLERMEQEALFLQDTGVAVERVAVEDEDGRVFWVAADGVA